MGSRYHLVEGICLFYTETELSYEDAKVNCESKFNGYGRLFEPKSRGINKKAHDAGIENGHGNWYWIGVNDQKLEGSWVYTNSGQPISIYPNWRLGYGSRGTGYNCVLYCDTTEVNRGKWCDRGCTYKHRYDYSYTHPSICECSTSGASCY